MELKFNTDVLPLVIPDTYGSGFQNEVSTDMWDDFKDLMIEKAAAAIKEALTETDFAEANLTMGAFKSPSFYNFGTDWIEFTIEVDDTLVAKVPEKVNDDFFDYIKKYGSRSGFVSFYPTTKETWLAAMNGTRHLKTYDMELALALYIMWQFEKEMDLQKFRQEYLDDVWEYASGNGYTIDEEEDDENVA